MTVHSGITMAGNGDVCLALELYLNELFSVFKTVVGNDTYSTLFPTANSGTQMN
jgi:hypothetical protein